MTGYAIALFVHITGALGIFAALSLEWTGLRQIGNAAAPEQVREWMGILKSVRKVGFVSMLAAVITGFYMMAIAWRSAAWIYVTLGALVLMIVLAQVVTSPRMAVIGKAMAAEKGMLSQTFYGLAKNPLLWVSIQTRAGIALGIVFLKIARPDWAGSLLSIGFAIVFGLVSTLPFLRSARAQKELAG